MSQTADAVPMTTYQFEIDDDEWGEWKETVPRSKALDERIRELILADKEGRVKEVEDEHTREESVQQSPTDDAVEATKPMSPTVDKSAIADAVDAIVERVSAGWEDTDERMDARRSAARAVLQHALDTGDAIGKADAIEKFIPEYAVDGQGDETWWRKNIRPVLTEVGDYSPGKHGYVIDDLDRE